MTDSDEFVLNCSRWKRPDPADRVQGPRGGRMGKVPEGDPRGRDGVDGHPGGGPGGVDDREAVGGDRGPDDELGSGAEAGAAEGRRHPEEAGGRRRFGGRPERQFQRGRGQRRRTLSVALQTVLTAAFRVYIVLNIAE